jgi:hypothetical protein
MQNGVNEHLLIFPLAQVVLFPGVRVPLYVFEPRYRAMLNDALETDQKIGMVTVRPEGVPEMVGTPTIFPVGCEGTIVHSEARDDGTSNIVLQGTTRFRIKAELPLSEGRLYRVARVEYLNDPFPAEDRDHVAQLRGEVFEMLREVIDQRSNDKALRLPDEPFVNVEDATVANALSQALSFSPLEKQGLLEADGIRARFERLAELLRFQLMEHRHRNPAGEGIVH